MNRLPTIRQSAEAAAENLKALVKEIERLNDNLEKTQGIKEWENAP